MGLRQYPLKEVKVLGGKEQRFEKLSGRRENDCGNIGKGEGGNGRVLSEKRRGSERLSGRSKIKEIKRTWTGWQIERRGTVKSEE